MRYQSADGVCVCVCLCGWVDHIPDSYRDDLLREIALMKHIGHHGNIVSMVGACTTRRPLALIMEYVPYGNLQNFLRFVLLTAAPGRPQRFIKALSLSDWAEPTRSIDRHTMPHKNEASCVPQRGSEWCHNASLVKTSLVHGSNSGRFVSWPDVVIYN